MQKLYQAKHSLVEKKSENDLVLQEFNLLEPEANVFKLVGPVLAKQDLIECKSNVEKRIEYIGKEM
jgi:prefoldin beta subunit